MKWHRHSVVLVGVRARTQQYHLSRLSANHFCFFYTNLSDQVRIIFWAIFYAYWNSVVQTRLSWCGTRETINGPVAVLNTRGILHNDNSIRLLCEYCIISHAFILKCVWYRIHDITFLVYFKLLLNCFFLLESKVHCCAVFCTFETSYQTLISLTIKYCSWTLSKTFHCTKSF